MGGAQKNGMSYNGREYTMFAGCIIYREAIYSQQICVKGCKP